MTSTGLSPRQAHALYNILSHHEAYHEIRHLKAHASIARFGPPFKSSDEDPSAFPLLRALLSRFTLPLPGLRDVSTDFWQQRCQAILEELADADFSESYDKGAVGIRRTLATAIAAAIEGPARGCLGGISKRDILREDGNYDSENPDDVVMAWEDFRQRVVYGDLIDIMFEKAAITDRLEDHEPLVQAAHEYVLITLASCLHYILILSPKGQALLSLIVRTNNMIPYFLIRQTLKMGNVASMINGMTKLLLAKISMNSVTKWFGMTDTGDTGMNLLQQIISTVMGWDESELRGRLAPLEKGDHSLSNEQLNALKAYVEKSGEEHEQYRSESQTQSTSIVYVILSKAFVSTALSETQHTTALDYVSILLSIRDRKQITNVLCNHQPDLVTSSVKDLVRAYEPIIRAVHKAVDLSSTIADSEAFMNDLIKASTMNDKKMSQPKGATVEDFVRLLRKHQSSSHRFLHQAAKNGQQLTQWYRDYAVSAAAKYRQNHHAPPAEPNGTAAVGNLTPALESLTKSLSKKDAAKVLQEIDAHADYLDALSHTSTSRMKALIANSARGKSESTHGPGMYLARWQALIDATQITPATLEGPVRSGGHESVKDAARVDVDGARKGASAKEKVLEDENPSVPDVELTVRLLLPGFKEALGRYVDG